MEAVKFDETSDLYKQALTLRYKTFFEPFGLDEDVTVDLLEPASSHHGLQAGSELIVYGRLSPLDKPDTFRVSQIIVKPDYRGQGLSLVLLRALINEACECKATQICLNAQVSATALYRKLGFSEAGSPYTVELTGVPHIKMKLDVSGQTR